MSMLERSAFFGTVLTGSMISLCSSRVVEIGAPKSSVMGDRFYQLTSISDAQGRFCLILTDWGTVVFQGITNRKSCSSGRKILMETAKLSPFSPTSKSNKYWKIQTTC